MRRTNIFVEWNDLYGNSVPDICLCIHVHKHKPSVFDMHKAVSNGADFLYKNFCLVFLGVYIFLAQCFFFHFALIMIILH